MTFTGAELFTVTNGTSPPCRKRLVDMDAFEVLCLANAYRRHGNAAMADRLWTWRRQRIQQTPTPGAA